MIKHILTFSLGAMLLGSWLTIGDPMIAQQPAPGPVVTAAPDAGFEVLARGQVHEAFAEPAVGRPLPSPLVPKVPPPAIEEMPPDQKPDGANVQWIGGYWAWDVDTANFIWISGLWRNLPPGRQWVPGSWGQTDQGAQWTRGFWADAALKDLQFLPAPPPSIDNGPSAAAPSADTDYVPGCWIWRDTRFMWRPGFWHGFQNAWIWTPAHYAWTPSGYVFAEGFWDYPLAQRGLLFAPVRFDRPLWENAGWSYRPRYAIYDSALVGALFIRPNYGTYYFGDYFDNRYSQLGLVPWVDYRIGRMGYDPLYSHSRWNTRGTTWDRDTVALYAGRRSGEMPRPPVTFAQQTTAVKNITNNVTNVTTVKNMTFLAPLDQVDKSTIKLHAVTKADQAQTQQYIQQMKAAGQQREKMHKQVVGEGAPAQPTDKPRTVPVNLPKPLAAVGAASVKATPPPPALPAHVDTPIPKHEPVKPVAVAPQPLTSPPVASPAKPTTPEPAPKVTAPPPPPSAKVTVPVPPPAKAAPPPPPPAPKATAPPPAEKGAPEKPQRP